MVKALPEARLGSADLFQRWAAPVLGNQLRQCVILLKYVESIVFSETEWTWNNRIIKECYFEMLFSCTGNFHITSCTLLTFTGKTFDIYRDAHIINNNKFETTSQLNLAARFCCGISLAFYICLWGGTRSCTVRCNKHMEDRQQPKSHAQIKVSQGVFLTSKVHGLQKWCQRSVHDIVGIVGTSGGRKGGCTLLIPTKDMLRWHNTAGPTSPMEVSVISAVSWSS